MSIPGKSSESIQEVLSRCNEDKKHLSEVISKQREELRRRYAQIEQLKKEIEQLKNGKTNQGS